MRKVLSFQEFNPRAYSAGPDWRTMFLRFCLMASVVVIPTVYIVLREVTYEVPLLGYLLAALAALYVPALLLIRRPSVKVTRDYQLILSNPKTVDPRILKKSAASAVVFFVLASFAVLTIGGNRATFHPERVVPVLRDIFTYENPFSFVQWGFFLLLAYTVVGGTLSMIFHQVQYVAHAITHRSAPSIASLHPYTRSLLNGTSPELRRLRSTQETARVIAGIVNTLEVQDRSPIARAVVKSLRAAA